MKVSDELKRALKRDLDLGHLREDVDVLLPRIIAHERCRELLKELDKYLDFSAGWDDKAVILNPEPINEIFNQIAKALKESE